jgi:hypothetical protein
MIYLNIKISMPWLGLLTFFNMNYKYLSFLKLPRLDTDCGTLCQLCLLPNHSDNMNEILAKAIQQNCDLTGFYLVWRPEGIFLLIIFQFEKKNIL